MPVALVVDDEPQMTAIVSFALETEGFNTVTCATGLGALRKVMQQRFDLIILDLMLPDISGTTVAKKIRKNSNVPIIMLTALGEVEQRVAGLEAGADDYLAKPFSPQELRLRARAIMRRTQPVVEKPQTEISYENLKINLQTGIVTGHGREIPLTETETKLLRVLMEQPNHVHSIRELLISVWETNSVQGGRNMVKTTIYRLRKKIQKAKVPDPITSIRGRGYTLGQPRN